MNSERSKYFSVVLFPSIPRHRKALKFIFTKYKNIKVYRHNHGEVGNLHFHILIIFDIPVCYSKVLSDLDISPQFLTLQHSDCFPYEKKKGE